MDNQYQTPVTPVVTPPAVIEQPKTNSFLVILLSILLTISVAISGFFAFQTQRLNEELRIKNDELKQTIQKTTEPVATESSEVDPTANWKKYTKNGFSFKYPNEWGVYQPQVEGNKFSLYVAPIQKINEISEMFSKYDGFGIDKSFTLIINEVDEIVPYKSDEYQKFTISTYKLDNVSATKYVGVALQDLPNLRSGDKSETITFQKDGKNYLISLLDYQHKDIFDQILSTFKFLD